MRSPQHRPRAKEQASRPSYQLSAISHQPLAVRIARRTSAAFRPTPKAFHNIAQGRDQRERTLGGATRHSRRRERLHYPLPTIHHPPSTRAAFTLIELIIVILVMLILLTLTVSLVGNILDSDRVDGAARQVRNYLAGARDRAIYAASRMEGQGIPPRVGVRFLSNPSLQNKTTGTYRGFSSMVYVQEIPAVPTMLHVHEYPAKSGQYMASQLSDKGLVIDRLQIHSISSLIQRGLVFSRIKTISGNPVRIYFLQVTFDGDTSLERYYVKFNKKKGDSVPGYVNNNGYLINGAISKKPIVDERTEFTANCHIHLMPAPMPNEEPRPLPEGTVISTLSSLVGSAPQTGKPTSAALTLKNLMNANGSFTVMFNAQGIVDGPLAAFGMLHLTVVDLEDLARGYRVITYSGGSAVTGSPFVDSDGSGGRDDSDGDGKPDQRLGDVQIVSLRTQTGSAFSTPLNPVYTSGKYTDPFKYAEAGKGAP